MAYLDKIKENLPSWARNATFDLDGDDEHASVTLSFHGVPMADFGNQVDTRIHVLNQAMVKS